MQHMFDPTVGVAKREERGLDVNDITATKNGKRPTMAAMKEAIQSRAQAIRPKIMEYDIINPHGEKLRMSAYGKNVINSRSMARRSVEITGSPAGKKILPKQGEANLIEIWPSDAQLRGQYVEREARF